MMELLAPVIASVLALLTVLFFVVYVIRQDKGNERMQYIARLIQQGARAFLRREYTYVSVLVVIIAILIAIAPRLRPGIQLGWGTSIAFIIGAIAAALSGFIGMSIATRSSAPTAQAAATGGLRRALSVAISGGAVMGLSVVGISLLGLVLVYVIFKGNPTIVNGYAMGASFVALFARSGGGIFTKGADMGADLVGKVEAGIPEDDPRNPGVIADNVGDNVGDVAGMGADLNESFVESIIATMAIAAGLGLAAPKLGLLPMYIASAGVISSILGVLFVKLVAGRNPQGALMGGTYLSAVLAIVATYYIVKNYGMEFQMNGVTYAKMGPFYATIAGIISGIVVGFISEYFTSAKYRPVKQLAEKAQTGPAIAVVEGLAVGMQSTAIPVIVIAAAVVIAHKFAGMYGIALASLGMLATTGMIVSVDSYGPIADNAGGIAEMAKLPPEVRKQTDLLDAVGNTTAAIGKGFAIGSAAFAAIGLQAAFMQVSGLKLVDMKDPKVVAGLLLGGMLPFLFSSWLFRAVSRCAFGVVNEVRRQFKEIPGLLEGKADPDPATCVDIATRTAIRGMLLPGIMAIAVPVIIGFWLGPDGLMGVLVGAVVSGVMLGINFANSGGAMDNAKKYIEEGHFGGKGTPTHAAAVVGDTVGDPLKDTVGPSINILIKLMAVVSLVLAPLFIK